MKINLLDLHVPEEDTVLRRCLRVYTILPKFCKKPDRKNVKAQEIMDLVFAARKKLKERFGKGWRRVWAENIPYKMQQDSIKDWLIGRASIPIVAIDALKNIGCKKEAQLILENAEYIASTTQDVVRVPKEIDATLAYLSGLILGDGYLKSINVRNNFEHTAIITSGDREFLKEIKLIIENTFETKVQKLLYHFHSGASWNLCKSNKAIFRIFTRVIGLPSINKAGNAAIPEIIKQLPFRERIAFLAGLIDSDIGKHSGGLGCTFKSKVLVGDLILFLQEMGIKSKHYGSHYKNNKYLQHDFTIPKSQIKSLKALLLKNFLPKKKDRLETINKLAGIG